MILFIIRLLKVRWTPSLMQDSDVDLRCETLSCSVQCFDGLLYVWQLIWDAMVGHSGGSPPSPRRCLGHLIRDLAAEQGRKTAAGLRSHKQDVRDTLSQYTHTLLGGRGGRWVRRTMTGAGRRGERKHTHERDTQTQGTAIHSSRSSPLSAAPLGV